MELDAWMSPAEPGSPPPAEGSVKCCLMWVALLYTPSAQELIAAAGAVQWSVVSSALGESLRWRGRWHVQAHTVLLRSYFCKRNERTKAEATTNCRTNSVSQSTWITWHPFRSFFELKYPLFFVVPMKNLFYCCLNSIYICNNLLMQSCFSVGPWIYANENEGKSWSIKKTQQPGKNGGANDCKDQLAMQAY